MGSGDINRRILSLRESRGMSQQQLADASGLAQAYISRIETGGREPSVAALVSMAEALGTTALYLMFGQEPHQCPVCKREAVEHASA